jgi:cytochrome c2
MRNLVSLLIKLLLQSGSLWCPAITRRWATLPRESMHLRSMRSAMRRTRVMERPGLLGVIGRHAGSVLGFSYSQAMKNSNIVWDEKSLDAFLMTPQVGTTHRSTAAMASTWLRRNVRQLCEGGPRRWIIYFETVDSATSSPPFGASHDRLQSDFLSLGRRELWLRREPGSGGHFAIATAEAVGDRLLLAFTDTGRLS